MSTENFGEPSMPAPDSNNDNNQEVVASVLSSFKNGPPASLETFGEIEPTSEIFDRYDHDYIHNTTAEASFREKIMAGKDTQATNNFHMMFNPQSIREVASGKLVNIGGHYPMKAFYIDDRFDNAWQKLLQENPEDVAQVITWSQQRSQDSFTQITPEIDQALTRLARHLLQKGVPATVIAR